LLYMKREEKKMEEEKKLISLDEAVKLEQIYRGIRDYLRKQGGAARTLRDVEAETVKHNIEYFETRVYAGVNMYEVLAKVKSASEEGKSYQVRIRFIRLLIDEEISESTPVRVTDIDTEEVWYAERVTPETEVMVKCTCFDFLYRWQEPLHKNKALIGRPKKPKVKGAVTRAGRPWKSQNVERVVGACKHILAVVEWMGDVGAVGLSERYPREIVLS